MSDEPRIISNMRQWLLGTDNPYSDRDPITVFEPADVADDSKIENLDLQDVVLLNDTPDGKVYSVPAGQVRAAIERYGVPGQS